MARLTRHKESAQFDEKKGDNRSDCVKACYGGLAGKIDSDKIKFGANYTWIAQLFNPASREIDWMLRQEQ